MSHVATTRSQRGTWMAVTALAVAAISFALWSLSPFGSPLAATAHGGNSKLYKSVVTSISPADLPIDVQVKGGDDRLRIQNEGTLPLYVYGYENDPDTHSPFLASNEYLRIEPDGVFVNTRSPAYALNTTRSGNATVPDTKPGPPTWKQVQREVPSWTFHDHRIHLMSPNVPANVDTHSTKSQQVFTWKVPVKYGTQQGEINGKLLFIGGKASPGVGLYIAEGLIVLLAIVLVVGARWRRRNAAGAEPAVADPE